MKAVISFQISGLYSAYKERIYVLGNNDENDEICYLASQYFLKNQNADKKILFLLNPISLYDFTDNSRISINELNGVDHNGVPVFLIEKDEQKNRQSEREHFKTKIIDKESEFGYQTECSVVPYFGISNDKRYRVLKEPISASNIKHFIFNVFVIILRKVYTLYEEGFNEIDVYYFVDTGQNHLISLFKDAIYSVHHFLKIADFINYKGFIVSSEPYVGSKIEFSVNVFKEEITHKLFFNFPYEKLENVNKLVNHAFYLFNFLKHNIPLGFLTYLSNEELVEQKEKFLRGIKDLLENEYSAISYVIEEDEKQNKQLVFLSRGFRKALVDDVLSLGLGYRILKVFSKFIEKVKLEFVCSQNRYFFSINFLTNFIKFYEFFDNNLKSSNIVAFLNNNEIFYERDIKNLTNIKPDNVLKETCLGRVLEGKSFHCHKIKLTDNAVRNFVAHSGFENNIVKVFKKDDKLFLGYETYEISVQFLNKFLNLEKIR